MKLTASQLQGLQPDLLPPGPSAWPLAPGWWFALACLVMGLAVFGPRLYALCRRWSWRCYWRIRLELAVRKAASVADVNVAGAVATILRQAAIARFGQQAAGGLTGLAWLTFLERTSAGRAAFITDGASLLKAPFVAPSTAVRSEAAWQLVLLARIWVRTC